MWGKPAAAAVLVVAMGAISAHAAEPSSSVGVTKEVVRTVYGTPPQGQQHVKHVGDAVLHNEVFETWAESSALLEFLDRSHLTIGASSSVIIDEFVFDPATVQGNALINLSVGTVRFVTGEMPHGGVVIKTPSATLTLRGTDVSVRVHADGTTDTAVNEGEVRVHNDKTGSTTTVSAGEGATTGASGDQSFNGNLDPGSLTDANSAADNEVEHRRNDSSISQGESSSNPGTGPSSPAGPGSGHQTP
jgi:hypothetical protein